MIEDLIQGKENNSEINYNQEKEHLQEEGNNEERDLENEISLNFLK